MVLRRIGYNVKNALLEGQSQLTNRWKRRAVTWRKCVQTARFLRVESASWPHGARLSSGRWATSRSAITSAQNDHMTIPMASMTCDR